MSVAALLPPRVGKELRGLLWAWLACLVPMLAGGGGGGPAQAVGFAAYFIGAVALGALSIGQEYNSRTLTLMLSQPSSRERLLWEKAGVLAVMLIGLAAISAINIFNL